VGLAAVQSLWLLRIAFVAMLPPGWTIASFVTLATVGLIVGLWWTYFLVPFAQVLQKRRERGFLWGYGHAFVFAALAALSGGLEVMADLLRSSSATTSGNAANHAISTVLHQGATPAAAIAFAAGAVLMFLFALWWLGGKTTRRRQRSFIYLLLSTLVASGAVAAIALGLPPAWSFLLLASVPLP
jgi:hypothetical protein